MITRTRMIYSGEKQGTWETAPWPWWAYIILPFVKAKKDSVDDGVRIVVKTLFLDDYLTEYSLEKRLNSLT